MAYRRLDLRISFDRVRGKSENNVGFEKNNPEYSKKMYNIVTECRSGMLLLIIPVLTGS